MTVSLRWIEYESEDYEAMLRLREEVLRKPLGRVQERRDESCYHLLTAWDEARIVGCLTLEVEAGGVGRMRAVAVDASARGQGVGEMLVQELERKAKALGCETVYAHARQVVIGFYERLGYEVDPEVFEEVSLPHQIVRRSLSHIG